MNSPFKVTEKAMRPASNDKRCFYCMSPIGSFHKSDCVLIQKPVKIEAHIMYETTVPAYWSKQEIEFYFNQSTHCATNELDRMSEYAEKNEGCLCDCSHFDYVKEAGEAILEEE